MSDDRIETKILLRAPLERVWRAIAQAPSFGRWFGAAEPMTLVEFELATAEGGTLLTIAESGFNALPAARRAKALESNEGGWAMQATLIEKFLAMQP